MNAKLNFSAQLSKIAVKIMKTKTVVDEYLLLILVFIFLRIITMVISVFAGYMFFADIFMQTFETTNPVLIITLSAVLIILIEIINATLLTKFFKFIFKKRPVIALGLLFLSLLFYALNFHITTQGMAKYRTKQVDNTNELNSQLALNIENIKADNNEQISEKKKAIEQITVNPAGWNHGERTVLISEQLNQINGYYAEISVLKNKLDNDIKATNESFASKLMQANNTTDNEAKKYYNISIVIMLIQLLLSGVIAYFYYLIFNEVEKETVINEVISSLSDEINENTGAIINNNIQKQYTMYMAALNNHLNEGLNTTIKPNFKPEIIPVPPIKKHNIGFMPNNASTTQDAMRNAMRNESKKDSKTGICKQCNNEYTKKTTWQIYCCEECRTKSWEIKTGKNFQNRKK